MPTDTSQTQAPIKAVTEEIVTPATPPPAIASANVGDNTFGAGQIPDIVTRPPQRQGGGRGIMFAVIGVLFLLGAVGAGIVLVQQQQELREQAAPAQTFCGEVSQPINNAECDANTHCWKATAKNVCIVNGQPQGATEYFVGNSAWDGQVCYNCPNEPNNPVRCAPGNKVGGNNAYCPGGTPPQQPPPPPPPPPPAQKSACGGNCTTAADCKAPANQGTAVCRNGICENSACSPGHTIPGANCDCSDLNACGFPCDASHGLCQAGSYCGFINIDVSQCSANENKNNGKQYCLPNTPKSGYQAKACTGGWVITNVLFKDSGPVTSQAELRDACSPATPVPGTGVCTNVKVYDTSWTLLDAAAQAKLKAGDTIRVTVAGTASTGTVTKARFTFNGTLRPEVTHKKPSSEEFYDEIVIPAGATNLKIKGEIFHPDLGWF